MIYLGEREGRREGGKEGGREREITPCTFQIRDVMMGRPGVAAKLMYQLFVALNRKKVGA